nr:helix-turn-helix domain-containing protein [Modestobacter versicolor]
MVSTVRISSSPLPVRARLDTWDLGGISVLRADLTGELAFRRSPRQAREDTVPTVSFTVQEVGEGLHDHLDRRQVVPCGGLALTEVSTAYDYAWTGRGVCRALTIPVHRLGLPVDVVRRAVPLAHRSPFHPLVAAHLDQVTRDVAQLAGRPLVDALAAATIDLTRTLLASAAAGDRARADVAAETLLTRVRAYVRRHLDEPGLDAERIAAAHAISVRQLYRLCAAGGFSLEQWIIEERLEGARAELASAPGRQGPVAVVARRWGFSDPSYFSRRFRRAFGLTPREWRQASAAPSAPPPQLPRPRPRDDG